MLKHKWNTKQDKKISRNPVRILIFITRHRRQFSCKSEDRSQTRLFAYRYEWFRKKKKKEKKSGKQLLSSTQTRKQKGFDYEEIWSTILIKWVRTINEAIDWGRSHFDRDYPGQLSVPTIGWSTSVQEELGRPGWMIGRKVSRESSAFVSSISG